MCKANLTLKNNLNDDVSRIQSYFDTNKLKFNVPKCEFLEIETYQSFAKMPNLRIHINNALL